MDNKYFNDGIIGNRIVTASFSKKGELLRLYSGTVDYKQFIEKFNVGVKINDSAIIYLHSDINNAYNQNYIPNTNILQTEILNTYFNLRVTQTDFIPIKENILVKSYTLKNDSNIDFDMNFIIHSKIMTNLNNDTCGYFKDDALIQYNHDYSVCIFSKEIPNSVQINGADYSIGDGVIGGKDYVGMSSDSAISYGMKIPAGKEKSIDIYVFINDNSKKGLLNELDNELDRIRKIDMKKTLEDTKKYWKKYVKDHDKMGINKLNIDDRIKKIYNRSILLFNLVTNPETGVISAGIEVDENKTKCGRYSYCWPRDGVFITEALDSVGMTEEAEKFYSVFCKKTQSKNGMWEQRFYTDGRLAPCWGYQIDETASIVYGVYQHYKLTHDKEFLQKTYDMCQKAIETLGTFLFVSSVTFASVNKTKEIKIIESYDLWEMHEGIHLYSLSAIYAAFKAMIEIERILNENADVQYLEEISNQIKEYCLKNHIDTTDNTLKRNNKDNVCDISVLATVVPFKMINKNDERVKRTVEKINLRLRTYTGGYIRFENDNYMGGNNPWPIATLWMAMYNIITNRKIDAMEQINFVINSATKHGFLAEQVNNETMNAKWVIGLGWSHAMYIISLNLLS